MINYHDWKVTQDTIVLSKKTIRNTTADKPESGETNSNPRPKKRGVSNLRIVKRPIISRYPAT